jgi:toxin ParE1/3/4
MLHSTIFAASRPISPPITQNVALAVERRLHLVIARIARWPESAQRVAERPGVRVTALVRYPYKVFYRTTDEAVVILHIHHSSRQAPWEEE